jgi:putative tricarboxylic transport membrane protein
VAVRNANRICGAVALAVAAVVGWEARNLVILTAGVPGPGLLPKLAALGTALCGLGLLLSRPGESRRLEWPAGDVGRKIVGSIAALCVYVGLVPATGFLLATALFTAGLTGWWGGYRWWVAVLIGVGAAVAMFVLFDLLLGAPLPRGLWS